MPLLTRAWQTQAVEENVSSIVTNLIRLMNALAIDDVVKAMDHLIAHFGVHMLDYLQPLAEQLVVLYNKNVEAEDEEDNDGMDGMGMMAAENCVSTLGTLVQITTLRPKLYAPLEATVMPVRGCGCRCGGIVWLWLWLWLCGLWLVAVAVAVAVWAGPG